MLTIALTTLLLAAPPTILSATELLDDWQLEDAMQQSTLLLAEQPMDPQVQLLAAEVLHQRGAHVQALPLLRAAAAAGASSRLSNFRPLLEASASYAVGFASVETPHFSIRYLNKDEIVARYAAPVLEAAYRNIGGDLQFQPAERGEKIAVEIYPDARGLAGATGLTVKEIETSGTIAVCKFHRLMITSPLATADGYGWADTVAHEFTHLVISKKSHNGTPIWLHEGIAKYFESRWKGPAGEALQPYAEKLLAGAVRSGKFITFEQMHPSMAKLPSQEDAALAFAEVFTVIEYLTHTFGTASVAQVLGHVGSGASVEGALKKVYNMDLHELEKAWKKYLTKRPFHEVPGAEPEVIRLASGEEDSKKEKPLESMQDKAVHDSARLGELLQLRGQQRAAVVEYEKAMAKGGARYGTLVSRLARAYVDVDRSADALKLLDQSLAKNDDDNDAHLLAGRIRMKRGEGAQAKVHFEAVRMQNPFNPEIHMALAVLAKEHGDNATVELEKHFFDLSDHPRPTRTYDTPPPAVGEAYISLTSSPWGAVSVDQEAWLTPAWEHPVKAGAHVLHFKQPDGTDVTQSINVGPGGHGIAVLR